MKPIALLAGAATALAIDSFAPFTPAAHPPPPPTVSAPPAPPAAGAHAIDRRRHRGREG